jgi:hypothetical protein
LCVLGLLLLALPLAGSINMSSAQQAATVGTQDEQAMLVLRVYFRDVAERDRLAAELQPAEVGTERGYLTLWASEATYDSLVARGLRVEVEGRVEGVSARPAAAPLRQEGDTFYGGYRTVEGIYGFLDAQVEGHPTLAEKVDFGDSWCKAHAGACEFPEPTDGYDLWALHITNRDISGPKPVFWFDAAIHPEEIATSEVAMRFISWLLDGYDTNPDARWLVDYHDVWVVPLVNPDGHHIAEAGGEQPYLQRKNADNDDGCSMFPPGEAGAVGVDLNRNFPFKWACCGGAADTPCSHLYRGPQAASEEETQAVVGLLRKLLPDQRGPRDTDAAPLTATGIVQSMHAFANINIYSWGWSNSPAPNSTDLDNIGAHMSAPEAGGNGYKHCASGAFDCLYRTDGNTKDWVYGELGAAAFTTELEGETFFPAYGELDGVWNNNRGMLVYMAKIARAPYLLARGPDANSVAVEPQVVDAGSMPRISATINYNWTGNIYRQPVGEAEYYIDTPPWAGGTPHPMSPADGTLDGETEQVQAIVDTTGLTAGRHIVFVRGRGTSVYEGNPAWGPISAAFLEVVPSGGTPVPSFPTAPPASTATTGPVASVTIPAASTTAVAASTPLPPPVPLPGGARRPFPETGKTVSGTFLDYWQRNGGLAQQGYPISEVIGEVSDLNGQPYTVQYFERAVFEYHPEHAGTPFEVLLSQLGTFRYRQKYPQGAPGQTANTGAGSVLFPETGKRLGGRFLDYWQRNGGLAQQGLPISDEFTEVSDLNGQPYTVQYFERAVFELHPEHAGTPFEVLLSQLGTFRYGEKYGQR